MHAFTVSVMGQLTNGPAEKSVDDAESATMCPVSSATVPEPSLAKQNMSSVPEPVELPQNKSIPAAEAKSTVAFDELGGWFDYVKRISIKVIFFYFFYSDLISLILTAVH